MNKMIFRISTVLYILISWNVFSSCNKQEIIFNPDYVKEAFLLTFEDTGENTLQYFYHHGVVEIIKLLNTRKPGKPVATATGSGELGKHFLRLEFRNGPCTILFYDDSHFKMDYMGKEKNYYLQNFLETLITMDKHPAFDSADVISARMFKQEIRINADIPVSKVAPLLDILSQIKDSYLVKAVFKEAPQFILRIQLYTTGYQIFCGSESVWVQGKNGVYIYKSDKLKEILKEIAGTPMQRQ